MKDINSSELLEFSSKQQSNESELQETTDF